MLDSSAAQYLSNDISKKNKKLKNDHNKKMVQLIYDLQEEKITKILDKSMRELYQIFCSDSIEFTNSKIISLKNYVDELKEKNNDESYISKFENEAIKYEFNFKAIKGKKKAKI